MDDQQAIQQLLQSGNYQIIQRLQHMTRYHEGEPKTARVGIVIDTETTGLDTAKDKIIELGFVAFEYDAGSGRIYRLLHSYDGFEDPQEPLSDMVKQVTGITDEMLIGQSFQDDEIQTWLSKADLIVAHNAAFDRPLLERRFPVCEKSSWACTLQGIDWQAEGISSAKLDYIAYQLGFFFDAHRAENDARATLHILTKALPISGKSIMAVLLAHAREESFRIFAVGAAFDKKDELKERGYQWLAGFAYTDIYGKSKQGVWSKMLAPAELEDEKSWLNESIYHGQTTPPYLVKTLTAQNRYSLRESM